MLFVSLVLIILGLGTVIRNLIDLRNKNDINIGILDNIYSENYNSDDEK